jgi:hypothetical protein
MADAASKYLPDLQGSKFGDVTLLDLGTQTPGGFPLQLPESIRTEDELMRYLKTWQPCYTPGTYRTYANPSVGMLGLITTSYHLWGQQKNDLFTTRRQRPRRGFSVSELVSFLFTSV